MSTSGSREPSQAVALVSVWLAKLLHSVALHTTLCLAASPLMLSGTIWSASSGGVSLAALPQGPPPLRPCLSAILILTKHIAPALSCVFGRAPSTASMLPRCRAGLHATRLSLVSDMMHYVQLRLVEPSCAATPLFVRCGLHLRWLDVPPSLPEQGAAPLQCVLPTGCGLSPRVLRMPAAR